MEEDREMTTETQQEPGPTRRSSEWPRPFALGQAPALRRGVLVGCLALLAGLFLAGVALVGLVSLGSGPALASFRDEGGKIAFVSTRVKDSLGLPIRQIFVMNADGSCQTRLSHSRAFRDDLPAWSPNGQTIAFNRSDNPAAPAVPETGIWLMNADGSDQAPLAHDAGGPSWSPDGHKIAFGRDADLWVMKADGGDQAALTEGTNSLEPAWSPDGQTIAFTRWASEIWLMNADGGGQTLLADFGSRGFDPRGPVWSPDGKKIAFTSLEEAWPPIPDRVHVMNADGSGWTRLTEGTGRLTWSPDGERIAFARGGDIWIINADGRSEKRLTRTSLTGDPAWDDNPDWHWLPLPPRSQVCFEALRRNTKRGTARLTVRIPGPGRVVLRRGPGVRRFTTVHEDDTVGRVVLRVRPRGWAQRRLARTGRSQRQARGRGRALVTFHP
jgi:Tol biopolymer transport system component